MRTSYVTEVSWAEMPYAWVDYCCSALSPSLTRSPSFTYTFPLASSGERVAERILGLCFCEVCDAMLWQPCFPRESTGVLSLSTLAYGGKDQLSLNVKHVPLQLDVFHIGLVETATGKIKQWLCHIQSFSQCAITKISII